MELLCKYGSYCIVCPMSCFDLSTCFEPFFFFKTLHIDLPHFCLFLSFFKIFWPFCMACRILVFQPGIEPSPPVVEAQSLNHLTAKEVLNIQMVLFNWSPLIIFPFFSILNILDVHLWGLFVENRLP